jgi:hypothetical protein
MDCPAPAGSVVVGRALQLLHLQHCLGLVVHAKQIPEPAQGNARDLVGDRDEAEVDAADSRPISISLSRCSGEGIISPTYDIRQFLLNKKEPG